MTSDANVHLPEWMLWTGPSQTDVIQAVMQAISEQIQLLAVGGPRAPRVAELAKSLGQSVSDDLRATLVASPPAFVLIGADAQVDATDWQWMTEHQTRMLTLEPPICGLEDLSSIVGKAGRQQTGPTDFEFLVQFLPAFIHSPGLDAATEAIDSLGTIRAASWLWTGPARSATLFARLYDAWQTLLNYFDMPETISASFAGEGLDQDSLHALHGSLSLIARYPNTPAINIHVSDVGTRERRSWQLLSEQGEVFVRDDGFEHYDGQGELLDQSLGMVDATRIEPLIIHQIQQILTRYANDAITPPPRAHQSHIMACCIASQLSARTREAEQPERLLRML